MLNIIKEIIYKFIDNTLNYIDIKIDLNSYSDLYLFYINNIHINLLKDNEIIDLNILKNVIKTLHSAFKLNKSLTELNITINFSVINFKNKGLIIECLINLFSILTDKHFSKISLIINSDFDNEYNILSSKFIHSINNIILHNNNLQVLDLSKNSLKYIYYILTKLNNHNLKELIIKNYIHTISINEINNFKKLLDLIINCNIKINILNISDNLLDDLTILNSFILKNKYINKLILDNNNIDNIDEPFLDCLKNNNIIQYISLKNNLFYDNDKNNIKYFNILIDFKNY